jgi:hypothetical protein
MRQPKDYFTEISIDRGFADSLDSQWIPTDPTLWEIDNFQDFLSRRRELLADAANHFLADLKGGKSDAEHLPALGEATTSQDDPESQTEFDLIKQLVDLGISRPHLHFEFFDENSAKPLGVTDAFWPDGLQTGRGGPVALSLNSELLNLEQLAANGVLVFKSVEALRTHILRMAQNDAGAPSEL